MASVCLNFSPLGKNKSSHWGIILRHSSKPMEEIIIVGTGGFAREAYQWISRNRNRTGQVVKGFYTADENIPEFLYGERVFKKLPSLEGLLGYSYLIAIGNGEVRKVLAHSMEKCGLVPCKPVVAEHAIVCQGTVIGAGTIICPGVVITDRVAVGCHTILNLNSTVGHDTVLGHYVTVAPGVNISGNCRVEDLATLGTNSSLREKIKVGYWATLGMGAALTQDLPPGETWGGVPARQLLHARPKSVSNQQP